MDASIDAVGFEAKGSTVETVMANMKLEGGSGKALRQCIAAAKTATAEVDAIAPSKINPTIFVRTLIPW